MEDAGQYGSKALVCVWPQTYDDLASLVIDCCKLDPAERPSAAAVHQRLAEVNERTELTAVGYEILVPMRKEEQERQSEDEWLDGLVSALRSLAS